MRSRVGASRSGSRAQGLRARAGQGDALRRPVRAAASRAAPSDGRRPRGARAGAQFESNHPLFGSRRSAYAASTRRSLNHRKSARLVVGTGVQTGRSENVPLRARQRPGSSRPVRERRLASGRHHPAGDGEPARSTYSSLSLGPVTVLRSASSRSSPSRWAERELGIAPPTPPVSQRTERRARRRVLGATYRFEPAALSENQAMAVDGIIDNLSTASRSASSDKREATRRGSFAPRDGALRPKRSWARKPTAAAAAVNRLVREQAADVDAFLRRPPRSVMRSSRSRGPGVSDRT